MYNVLIMHKYTEIQVLELIRDGKLSVSRGADLLNKSVYEIYRLAKERNIEIGSTLKQYEKGKTSAKKIL